MSNPFVIVAVLDTGIIASYFLPVPEEVKWVINLVIGAIGGYVFYKTARCGGSCKE